MQRKQRLKQPLLLEVDNMKTIKAMGLATVLVASLAFSGCTFLSTREQEHVGNQMDLLEVEVRRAETLVERIDRGDSVPTESLVRFIRQRSIVITNVSESIRITVGVSGDGEEGTDPSSP
jgi:hypothetical protein